MSRSRRSTLLRGCVMSVEQEGVAAPHLFGQDRDEHVGDAGMLLSKPVELSPVDRVGLACLQRFDCRRPHRLGAGEVRLAERLAGPQSVNGLVPGGVRTRTAKRPFAIRCSESAGSPSWNTTSPRENVRRRATASSRRTSGVGTPEQLPFHGEVSRI